MKKLFAVLLIVSLSVVSVFADIVVVADHADDGVEGHANTKITLTIPENAVNYHRVGFSSDATAKLENSEDPTPLEDIKLTYTRGTDIEKETVGYVYYLFKAANKPYLKITSGSGLENASVPEKTISYTITTPDGEVSNGSSKTLTTNDLTNGVASGYIAFGIKILSSSITPDMATGSWTDELKITVTATA